MIWGGLEFWVLAMSVGIGNFWGVNLYGLWRFGVLDLSLIEFYGRFVCMVGFLFWGV